MNDNILPDMELVREKFEQVKEQRLASGDVEYTTANIKIDYISRSLFMFCFFFDQIPERLVVDQIVTLLSIYQSVLEIHSN